MARPRKKPAKGGRSNENHAFIFEADWVKGANFMKTDRTVHWMAIAAIVFGAVTIVAMRAMKASLTGG